MKNILNLKIINKKSKNEKKQMYNRFKMNKNK